MAKAILEKEHCASCGVDVREGSQFCYNCGEAIDLEPPPPAILKPEFPVALPADRPSGRRSLKGSKQAGTRPRNEEPGAIEAGPGLPEIRKRSFDARPPVRTRRKEKVAFEWVEPSRSPSVRLLLTAAVLSVLGGLMLLAALMLK